MFNTLLDIYHELYKHTERATKKKIKLYDRFRIKYVKYSNHLNFLNKCKEMNFIPDFIKIHKSFKSRRATRILAKTEEHSVCLT
jgi:hypothetical protein